MSPDFQSNIVRTLLYYSLFRHPLTSRELYNLFPAHAFPETCFHAQLRCLLDSGTIAQSEDFFQLPGTPSLSAGRIERMKRARQRMRLSRLMGAIIRRFPFVRGIFISGDLSKGVAAPESDIDYVIVTAPGRLWICRTLLILFKKIVLLNRKKYFCLNYFITENQLVLDERNYFTATEVAHLKPVMNFPLFLRYMNANGWIKEYFPNFTVFAFTSEGGVSNRASMVQRLAEGIFRGAWVDTFDEWLMKKMEAYWERRYPQYGRAEREKIFRCTRTESRAYAGNYADEILQRYARVLEAHHVSMNKV